jgi:hypothetical protein
MLLKRISKLNVYSFFSIACIIAFGMIMIISCGGGGDGTAPAPGPPPITYTGLTTQASIDTGDKAKALAAGAYGAGQAGSAFSAIGAVATGTDENTISFRTLKVTQTLKDALLQIDLSSVSGGPVIGATQSESGSISGPCGGTASYTIKVDDQTGVFSGSLNFSSYCDGGVTISGTTDFSGTLDLSDPNNPTFETVTLSFTNLTEGSATLSGTIVVDLSSSPIIVTFNARLKDNSTGKVYKVENYMMEITLGPDLDFDGDPDYVDVEISSGKYYDPDYGYVDVLTLAPFRINDGDEYPSSGILLVTGEIGIGGNNTEAQLEALDADTCQITADTDGDLVYDYDSGVINWTDL